MSGWLQRPLAFAYSDFSRARIYCGSILIGAAVVLAIGLWAASEFDEPENFKRAGGVVTSLSLLLVLSQFHFENRHKREEDQSETRVAELVGVRQYPLAFAQQVVTRAKARAELRVENTRYLLLSTSVVTGAIGEMVHALGDVVYELGVHLLV